MSATLILSAQARKKLIRELSPILESIRDFETSLRGVNDPEWPSRFQQPLELGRKLIRAHSEELSLDLAGDFAGLRSQISRHVVPREDDTIGPAERLKAIRGARGALLADIDTLLDTASSYGLKARQLQEVLPDSQVIERAGFDNMLRTLDERLRRVEEGVQKVAEASRTDDDAAPQQKGLVNFYVENLSLDVALARAEATASELIDFNAMARAIEGMVELTGDFVSSVEGMRQVVSQHVSDAASWTRKRVMRASKGFRTIIKRAVGPAQTGALTGKGGGAAGLIPIDDSEFTRLIQEGDDFIELGKLSKGRNAFERAHALAMEEQATTRRQSWERNLSVSHNRLGDVEKQAGDLAAARERYEAGLAIAETLAQREPGNAGWQRDLSVSHNKLGDVETQVGNLAAARERYEAGLAIRETLAQREPGNAEWQRDLSVSYDKLGDVERQAGNLAATRERYEAGLAIAETLAQREPGNAEWQRDLSVSYNKLGDVERQAGNLAAARERYEAGLAIAETLAQREPGNAEWQRDLWGSHGKLGQLALTEDNASLSLTHFRAAERVMATLVEQRPDHPGFAADLETVRQYIERIGSA
ncbi:MAG: tetratricopeptide repeat protein [Pseudomonadota bacterium]